MADLDAIERVEIYELQSSQFNVMPKNIVVSMNKGDPQLHAVCHDIQHLHVPKTLLLGPSY